jgi:hypothetical protein
MHEEIRRICDGIAAERDPMRIAHALYAGLGPSAHVTVVVLFVFDAARQKLRRHAVEKGREIPYGEFDLMELESFSARSARNRAEIHVDAEEGVRAGSRIPGTETTRSLWFGPMLDSGDLMGVLSVQSSRLGAYGDAEKRMFRVLAECVGRALATARREAPG